MLASGALADRFDRRRLMIAGDLIRARDDQRRSASCRSPTSSRSRCCSASSRVFGVGQAIFQPAFSSIVPTLVPEDLLVEANSLAQFVRPVAFTLVGPLIGGVLIGCSARAGPSSSTAARSRARP